MSKPVTWLDRGKEGLKDWFKDEKLPKGADPNDPKYKGPYQRAINAYNGGIGTFLGGVGVAARFFAFNKNAGNPIYDAQGNKTSGWGLAGKALWYLSSPIRFAASLVVGVVGLALSAVAATVGLVGRVIVGGFFRGIGQMIFGPRAEGFLRFLGSSLLLGGIAALGFLTAGIGPAVAVGAVHGVGATIAGAATTYVAAPVALAASTVLGVGSVAGPIALGAAAYTAAVIPSVAVGLIGDAETRRKAANKIASQTPAAPTVTSPTGVAQSPTGVAQSPAKPVPTAVLAAIPAPASAVSVNAATSPTVQSPASPPASLVVANAPTALPTSPVAGSDAIIRLQAVNTSQKDVSSMPVSPLAPSTPAVMTLSHAADAAASGILPAPQLSAKLKGKAEPDDFYVKAAEKAMQVNAGDEEAQFKCNARDGIVFQGKDILKMVDVVLSEKDTSVIQESGPVSDKVKIKDLVQGQKYELQGQVLDAKQLVELFNKGIHIVRQGLGQTLQDVPKIEVLRAQVAPPPAPTSPQSSSASLG